MIKPSKVTIKYANKGKLELYHKFIQDYKEAVIFYVDYLWNNKIVFSKQNRILDIKNDLLDCPQFINIKDIKPDSPLSGRALKTSCTQACGIISSIVKQKYKLQYIKKKLESENKDVPEYIITCLNKVKLTKPIITSINPEINSNNIKYELSTDTSFDAFITLFYLGYKKEKR